MVVVWRGAMVALWLTVLAAMVFSGFRLSDPQAGAVVFIVLLEAMERLARAVLER